MPPQIHLLFRPFMRSGEPVNLDANASFGVLPEVVDALRGAAEWLNPSSIHGGGQRARAAIESARDSLGALLDLQSGERIIFTSGATEASNTALVAPFREKPAGEIVTTAIEHASVLEPALRLRRAGVHVHVVPPARDGSISPDQVEHALTSQTRLVSVMAANNETGQILPVREIAARVRTRAPAALIHSDAVQLLGKSVFRFADLGADLISLSGHKIGALPGVGALVVRDELAPEPLLAGGPQESRWRAGTENVPGIVSFGVAAEVVRRSLERRIEQQRIARDRLVEVLLGALSDASVNAAGLPPPAEYRQYHLSRRARR